MADSVVVALSNGLEDVMVFLVSNRASFIGAVTLAADGRYCARTRDEIPL
jgi:hypothetical protein